MFHASFHVEVSSNQRAKREGEEAGAALALVKEKRKGERVASIAYKKETWLAIWSWRVTRELVKKEEKQTMKKEKKGRLFALGV